ncbi:MAG: DUF5777 family beta-barrel protein [Ginsengibacter sp.]
MRLIKLFSFAVVLCSLHGKIIAQDTTNLINQLEKETGENKTVYTTATFKSTRVIDGHSVENLPAHVLDVRISHRFGPLSQGLYNFFGFDYSPFNVRVGFDYGITDNFMIGGGHNAWQKTYDAFFKWKILRQSSGAVNMPVTVSLVSTFAISTIKSGDFGFEPSDSLAKTDRLSYVFQLLIGRKFSEGLSLQLMPTFIRTDNVSFNHFKDNTYKRNILAIGIAGKQSISRKMSINAEYYYQLPGTKAPGAADVFAFGIDIGTGGHVFQLQFTNSIGLTEKSFIAETSSSGDNSDLRFGFNISRVFQLGKKHKGAGTDWKKK